MKFLVNPSKFNEMADYLFRPLLILSIILFVIGLLFSFYLSPDDYQQGSTVRIMYVHVPSAWLALLTYAIMTLYSILALAFRIPFGFIFNTAVAPIGAVFTLICIISGSLWGKPMWGTWWVWDARLTSVLVLFFLYLGYMALVNAFDDPEKGSKAAAVLALIGFVNVPIIKFSVDWWNTLHQPASLSRLDAPAIDISMLTPLLLMALGFKLLLISILIIKMRTILIEKRIEAKQLLKSG